MPDIIVGEAIGRYTIDDVISHGGTATVYRAHVTDQADLPPVAIKVVNLGEGYEEAFNEAELLMNLSHSGLPRVYEAFEEEERLVVVEELIEGQTLDAYVQDNGPFPEADVISQGLELASILSYLHERPRKVIHRDLKPGNIMRSEHGLMLVDFGIAKILQPGKDYDTVYAYTQRYASPEQLLNRGTDERSDVYSFGATLAFMATGLPTPPALGTPVAGGHTVTVKDVSPERLHSAVTPELRAFIMKCMEFDPEKRYQDFHTAIRALRRVQRGLKPDAWRPPTWMVAATAGVVLLSALFAGWWFWLKPAGITGGHVDPPPTPPVLEVAQKVAVGASVTAELTWETAPKDAATTAWAVKDVTDSQLVVKGGNGATMAFTPAAPGQYVFEATYDGKSYTKTVDAYVDFRAPTSALKDSHLSLTASESVKERAGVSYTWRIQSPTGSDEQVKTTTPATGYRLTQIGTYRITLITSITVNGKTTNCESVVRSIDVYDIDVPSSASATNLNPSFENVSDGVPVVWSILSRDTALDSSFAFRGQYSLRTSGTSPDVPVKAMEQVRVERGTKYRAQMWVRGYKATGSPPYLEIRFRSRNSDTYLAPEISVSRPDTGTYEWARLMLEFTTPTRDDCTLEIRLVYPGRGSVWFDHIIIQPIR